MELREVLKFTSLTDVIDTYSLNMIADYIKNLQSRQKRFLRVKLDKYHLKLQDSFKQNSSEKKRDELQFEVFLCKKILNEFS